MVVHGWWEAWCVREVVEDGDHGSKGWVVILGFTLGGLFYCTNAFRPIYRRRNHTQQAFIIYRGRKTADSIQKDWLP